jgi:hypothetical protein
MKYRATLIYCAYPMLYGRIFLFFLKKKKSRIGIDEMYTVSVAEKLKFHFIKAQKCIFNINEPLSSFKVIFTLHKLIQSFPCFLFLIFKKSVYLRWFKRIKELQDEIKVVTRRH